MRAFLGLGLLGGNFARAALARGEAVRVWNRSPEKAEALRELGAVVCADPAEAVRGVSRVHLVLSDDAAVEEVLARAQAGLSEDAIIIDHTTTDALKTRARTLRLREQGRIYQHAPVFMGPQNARDATGLMLISGEASQAEWLRPELERMTGKLWYLGPELERAAAFKLFGNLFLMFITAGLADMFTLAQALSVTPEDAAQLFEHFKPGANLKPRLERMFARDFSNASWELGMARKDAGLMLHAAEAGGHPLRSLGTIAANMDALIASGHGRDDWTVLAKEALLSGADAKKA